MECGGHVFEDQSRDPIRTRCFAVWYAAESYFQYRRGDASGDHRDGVSLVGCNVREPRERCSRWKCGVRRKSRGFKLSYLSNNLLRVFDEAARGGVPYDREVCGERLRVLLFNGRAEDGLQGHLRLFYKHSKEDFPILQLALVAGVF